MVEPLTPMRFANNRYFNYEELLPMIGNVPGMEVKEHRYFQWRFNNRVFAVKTQ